jgi:quercetin dioxygenase-like cupin family protein
MAVLPAPPAHTHEAGPHLFTSLATPSRGTCETSVWSVEMPPGEPGALHRITREEVFVVLRGSAEVCIDGEVAHASAGDAIVVPADTPFTIAAAGSEPLRALCILPVGGQARHEGGEPFTPPWAR